MWNWQYKNWPRFVFDPEALRPYEDAFIHKAGLMQGSLVHINDEDKDSIIIDLLSEEALKTSEIEGEILSRESVQSSIQKHFGLRGQATSIPPAEQGIADMMMEVYRHYDSPLTKEHLFNWQEMLCLGRRDLTVIGNYRQGQSPMQIISNELYEPVVHFEAPPSERVAEEMQIFLEWFNHSRQEGETTLPALTRAGIAHLYFESIHPFEDGNGRIGRAISEKALSQSLGKPTLISLAQSINASRKDYYAALQAASKRLDIQAWLIYFCETCLNAQEITQSLIDFIIEKIKFYQRFEHKLNTRQSKVIARLFKAGIHGFEGGLSADNFIKISGTSRATATRDLQDLVEIGALQRKGQRRYTRYFLNIDHSSIKQAFDN